MQKKFVLSVLCEMLNEGERSVPPNRARLSALLHVSPEAVDTALIALESAGFVDAKRVRLTLAGLAVAAATRRSVRAEELAA
jgi:Mn-dependent DtxR family transcriptional regulator